MNRLLFFGPGLVAVALLVLEWRRLDRRRLSLRLAATLAAALALTLLAWPPEPAPQAAGAGATLWTPGAGADPSAGAAALRFALPESRNAPPGTLAFPDVGTLRRRFPGLRSLRIVGDGLDPAELPALAGLRVEFGSTPTSVDRPGVVFLHAPRQVPLGDAVTIQGRVAGLPPGGTLPVSLRSPDGTLAQASTPPADATGTAAFELSTPALPAAGCFLWRLHAGDTVEPLGVAVVPPVLPRVLILESAPRFETATLRRWFGGLGGTLVVRTQLGQDVFRTAAARGGAPPLPTLDGSTLGGFDLVLADENAVAALPTAEQTALAAAIEQTGLGLLVLAETPGPGTPAGAPPLLPWKREPLAGTAPGETRSVRLHWPGRDASSELPLPAMPFSLEVAPGQTTLVADGQQQPLVVARLIGHGQLALTLVRDTDRLLRNGSPAAFASYWSRLFGRLARPRDGADGRWTLLDGDGGPVLVDHPLALVWSGPPGIDPSPAVVTRIGQPAGTSLPLAGEPAPSGQWRTTFWPREPGWYHLADAPGNAARDFYVHPRDSWPAWRRERRRQETGRFAADSVSSVAPSSARPVSTRRLAPGWWFALFLCSAAFLWTERRFARS